MPLILQPFFTHHDCRAKPQTLFAFGDNLQRTGKGGQAIIRDEPNAIGLVSKLEPTMKPTAFLKDKHYSLVDDSNRAAKLLLVTWLQLGRDVIYPANGIGTGLADLETHAPRILAYYKNLYNTLINAAGT